MTERKAKSQGMNWLRIEKRLALYLRDGLACAYCGATIEDGARLTLDHLTPYSKHGNNEAGNLITACLRCNSSRGNRDYKIFAKSVANYLNHGVTAGQILSHIRQTVKRPLNISAAKEIIARRGGFTAALKAAQAS
jgi:hypothetical protein